MITQQLLSRAGTSSILIKDVGSLSIYNTEAVVHRSPRCVNANYGEADGNTSRWEYGEMESAADGRTALYLTGGRWSDRDELRL